MNVYEAVRSRRSVRGFLGRPVPDAVLTRVLSAALRAPSGGNLQPWQVYLLSGSRLEDLKSRVRRRIAAGDSGDPPPVRPYPAALPATYAQRLTDMGERRYGAVGISLEDKDGRARVRARNWDCFGAPTALFCYLDEGMLPPQWMDAGIFLQSVMLLRPGRGTRQLSSDRLGRIPPHRRRGHPTAKRSRARLRHVDRLRRPARTPAGHATCTAVRGRHIPRQLSPGMARAKALLPGRVAECRLTPPATPRGPGHPASMPCS